MPARAPSSCALSPLKAATKDRSLGQLLISRRGDLGQWARGHQLDRKAVSVTLARLQRPDADDLSRDFFTLFVGDRDHHAILALFAARRVMNRALDAHGRNRLRLRLRVDRIETQMVMAARANVRTL